MQHRKSTLAIIATLIAIIAVLAFLLLKKPQSASQSQAASQAMQLAVLQLKKSDATLSLELPGRVAAFNIAEIRPQVGGIVSERTFEEGSTVVEGTQLYQIDPSIFQASFNKALADLSKAEATERAALAKKTRYEKLVKIAAVSQQEYDDIEAELAGAEADVAIAEATVAVAKTNLDFTKVYAPITGQISKSTVTKGALVTANQSEPLAIITSLNPVYVDISQSARDLLQLRSKLDNPGDIPVLLSVDGVTNGTYGETGKLQFHEVNIDQSTGSVQLRAVFPNPDKILLPGLFVKTKLAIKYSDAILIPQHVASRTPDGNLSVWVMNKNNEINPVTIHAQQAENSMWLVTDGLSDGDIIVTEGLMKLQPGMKIAPQFKEPEIKENTSNKTEAS